MTTAIVNGYTTLAALKAEKGISDTTDDENLSIAINAASRQIDNFCGQRFWQDSTVVAYEFFPDGPTTVQVDELETLLPGISTLTGLVVKVDIDLDGVFETTLVINTDFMTQPRNALAMVPAHPITSLSIVPIGSQNFFPMPRYGRASVQVTCKQGWPAVPDDVSEACLRQAAYIAKGKDLTVGGMALGDAGAAVYAKARLHPMAEASLAAGSYQKPCLG